MKKLVPLILVLGACSTSSSAPDDTDGGARSDAGSMLSTDSGQAPEDDASVDAQSFPTDCHSDTCESARAQISADGDTPWGRFVAEQAAVSYTAGFTNFTTVTVYGTLEGKEAALIVHLTPSPPEVDYVAQPGTYEDVNSGAIWGTFSRPTSDGQCVNEEPAGLKAVIVEHQGPTGDFKPGDPVVPKGSLTVQGAGWDLEIPFEMSAVCDRQLSL